MASEGEGAYLLFWRIVNHLPLRGKLGWMTPRAGVKTTLASEMRLPGLPDPKRGPHFFWPAFFSTVVPACTFPLIVFDPESFRVRRTSLPN